jgi:fermentation-respiration switch protein FrsA (DUF1100 family)
MSPSESEVTRIPVLFPAEGHLLAGVIHRSHEQWHEPQPGVVVSGSWLTVKEQMAGLYADRLAARGYTALSFDFSGWGESSGSLRQTEIPQQKISDMVAATRFLASLSSTLGNQVGYVGICASAMYAAAAVERGAPIAALASVAGWFHDTATVASYYGGTDGIRDRLERATLAHRDYLRNGEARMVPAYEEGNMRAGMFIPMDYYANPDRGRIPAWRNQMCEITWTHWLTFDGLSAAERLAIPTVFVHGDECALPDNVRRIHVRMPGTKHLVWHPGFQVDYYDRPDLVSLSVDAADKLLRPILSRKKT